MLTTPSITRANSSWAALRHSEVPSARITSRTYSWFCATTTFSQGDAWVATSKTLEKA